MKNLPLLFLLLFLSWNVGRFQDPGLFVNLTQVNGVHPECRFQLEIHKEETKCMELLKHAKPVDYKGCVGVWDNITCWRPAKIGETVTVPCPKIFSLFSGKPGNISKNCTSNGWSDIFPDILSTCGYNDYEDEYKVGCKAILVFFQYGVMANFYWLLVEGLYLHILLVLIFSPNRHFTVYLLIGWGIPTIFIITWTVTRIILEDTGSCLPDGISVNTIFPLFFYSCWDTNEHGGPWWVIRIPILISIIHFFVLHLEWRSLKSPLYLFSLQVNFILFISIIRILLQKLRSPDVGGNDQSQYKRLAKSTLLLIPLFGVHYTVFALFPDRSSNNYKIIFELCLGSFQHDFFMKLYMFPLTLHSRYIFAVNGLHHVTFSGYTLQNHYGKWRISLELQLR
ncbi:hypothetical protein ASZ78_017046 [Callipepla squamata]|uniref:Vasoactive intestinal polypeptide receptor 2 n=1 Tax=Callipepla squamata TaxID=9009 RepID=A0A226NHU1_CALSU|nr:hypothetical protein ASZ78_017046 [Callipepla squamata]